MPTTKYPAVDAAIRKELRRQSDPDWRPIRATFPSVPKSSFYNRIKAVERALQEERRAKRLRLAEPLSPRAGRRDPFALMAECDLRAELVFVLDLSLRLRAASLEGDRIKNPVAHDQSIQLRNRIVRRMLLVRKDRERFDLWHVSWSAAARTMGRSTSVQLSHFRKQMLLPEQWSALQIAIGALRDAKLLDTGPNMSSRELYEAARSRLYVLERLEVWRNRQMDYRMMGRQVAWILERVQDRQDLSLEVVEPLRQMARLWVYHVAERCAERRGIPAEGPRHAVAVLHHSQKDSVPGLRAAMTFARMG
ncbi:MULTISPECIES: hypothetical protein [unclassified Brevundimonas]|uniref:hypothetical protein n=1 Tax=unclassified Brevundimonas TaxID=2622653 RepID=UPI0006F4AE7E|nr:MULTISPECIES: hypothetical protein [unclassified Brevundimonas]KQY95062.1 hypothetical protein ASD25_17235 [Brevundimonas sp. Root1423]KRA28549.1 hypothetical protein ASD59_01575 [Brevundimonas sp. Root608]